MTTHDPKTQDEALAELGRTLLDAHRVANAFLAFTEPLLAKVQTLHGMFFQNPGNNGAVHPWARPGLHVSPQIGRGVHLALDVPGVGQLSVDDLGQQQYELIGYHFERGNTTQVRLHLQLGFYQQNETTKKHWESCFVHAAAVLDRTIECIRDNTPMQPGVTWPEALRTTLENEDPVSYGQDRWESWLSQWGTPEMQTSFSVTQSLFNVEREHEAWSAQLLQSWSCAMPTLAMPVAEDLFEPQDPL